MKKIFLIITLTVCVNNLLAQIPSSCNVPSVLQLNYEKDVKHLTLERLIGLNSPFQDSVIIPQSFQDTIWSGLAAIFNLTGVPDRDSVFDNYCIHQQISSILNQIIVSVDTSWVWTHQWMNLNTTTGLSGLDNLLATYNFTVISFSAFGNYAVLATPMNINVAPLCDSIESFGGVLFSEPNGFIGDGNEINYNKIGTDRFYYFSIGYGDCPAGCTSHRTFRFQVYDDCSVDNLGVYVAQSGHDVLPQPVNCNITNNIQDQNGQGIAIYPNPFADEIFIKGFSGKGSVEFFDIAGKKVLMQNIFSDETKIITENLSPGIYFMKHANASGETLTVKIVKVSR